MQLFSSTLAQMGYLLTLIAIGFILTRLGVLKKDSAAMLSKMENNIFIPALILSTFMENFTVERLTFARQYAIAGIFLAMFAVPLGIIIAKLLPGDDDLKKINTYSLVFSNFGFMGNTVVQALFPEVFMEYLILTLPFWVLIYVWAVPYLLVPASGSKGGFLQRMKALVNPMFIFMLIGMALGLLQPPVPGFLSQVLTTLGSCMSPIAMLLTGITIASISIRAIITNVSIYGISLIRLVALPLAGIGILCLIPIPTSISLCIVCFLAMPLGLNTVVIPAAYGKDTTAAAGMALISHVLSCGTIPLVFMLAQSVL